jgi:hypothetical protein
MVTNAPTRFGHLSLSERDEMVLEFEGEIKKAKFTVSSESIPSFSQLSLRELCEQKKEKRFDLTVYCENSLKYHRAHRDYSLLVYTIEERLGKELQLDYRLERSVKGGGSIYDYFFNRLFVFKVDNMYTRLKDKPKVVVERFKQYNNNKRRLCSKLFKITNADANVLACEAALRYVHS